MQICEYAFTARLSRSGGACPALAGLRLRHRGRGEGRERQRTAKDLTTKNTKGTKNDYERHEEADVR